MFRTDKGDQLSQGKMKPSPTKYSKILLNKRFFEVMYICRKTTILEVFYVGVVGNTIRVNEKLFPYTELLYTFVQLHRVFLNKPVQNLRPTCAWLA